jgi:hypothetical protein
MMIPNILMELSPAERVAAATSGLTSPRWEAGVLANWSVWAPMLVAVVVGITLIVLYRGWARQRRAFRACLEAAGRLGLSAEERAAVLRIASLAGLARLDLVFSMPEAFERGADRLRVSEAVLAMPPEGQEHVESVIDAVRAKLGFKDTDPLEPAPVQRLALEAGAALTVVSRETPLPVQVRILKVMDDGVLVQTTGDVPIQAGAVWRMQYADQGLQWEVDARVVEGTNQRVFLKLVEGPRCVNRRRFIRMPTHRAAFLARFHFTSPPVNHRGLNTAAEGDLPTFVPGILTEIAGPGVCIEAPLQTQVGERVLIVMRLSEDKVIQGVGLVRRAYGGEVMPVTVAELLGLSNAEISDLVRETNAAARRAAASAYLTPGDSPGAKYGNASVAC